jgi:hypothetical protein
MEITKYEKFDDYMTPKSAWAAIAHLIPKDKVIWEPFYGDGSSGNHLRELGFQVIHDPIDFYNKNCGDIIVSNPPFSDVKNIIKRLKELKKPWILLMPVQKLSTNYFRENVDESRLQLVIPHKRVNFNKMVNGVVEDSKRMCPFDCYYYFYDCNLPERAMWLKE